MWCFYLFLSTFFLFSSAHPHAQSNAGHETEMIPDTPEGIYIASTPGTYSYRATNKEGKVTGFYLLADAADRIKITFTQFDVPCGENSETGSLVQYTDGWELNRQVFPITESHPDPKVTEFCSNNPPGERTFVSSQNGALITFKIFEVDKGFTVKVEHQKHPSPCNVISNGEPYVVLRNHGSKINCSYWFISKAKVTLNSYSIGNSQSSDDTSVKCSDRIEIGGSDGLDPDSIELLDTVCNNSNDKTEKLINCSTTTIKLVSSGAYENYLNVTIEPVDPEEPISNTKYRCHQTAK
ncbi:corticotropin-releasing factor-binding protein isoform X2 [Nasonia vitripennis]|uniref:Corticotropin-releasing factor-binding protein n=1 Tax=Nasonia vitripennis TaxID=7425 RepID=A0A7M7IT13_NASVI|nr:corticotropin-releasing factor-binding protein isoform X2 [Nasonia vitripennis]